MNCFSLFLSVLAPMSLMAADATFEVVVDGGVASETSITEPFSVAFDKAGAMYGVEFTKSNRVFKLTPDRQLSFVAGKMLPTDMKVSLPESEVADGPALQGRFNGLHDLCLTYSTPALAQKGGPEDVILLADSFNHRIRQLDLTNGMLSTVVGNGKAGYNGDANAPVDTLLNIPICFSAAPKSGQFWITDIGNNRVRIFDATLNRVIDAMGNGKKGKLIEGANPDQTPLGGVRAVAADARTSWLALREGNALVENHNGEMRTVINVSGKAGYSGDGADDARNAQLNGPKYLCLDAKGNVIICDTENHVIRRYLPGKRRVELIAGVPAKAGKTATQLNRPHGACLHQGWLYIADTYNDRVVRMRYPTE